MAPSGSKRKRKTGVEGKNVSSRGGLLFLLTAIADRKEGRGGGRRGGGQNCQAPLFLFTFSCYTFFSCRSHSLFFGKARPNGRQILRTPSLVSPSVALEKRDFPSFYGLRFSHDWLAKGREGRRNVSLPLPAFYSFCSTSHTVKRRRERKR